MARIAIVGAGLTGLAAALFLARRGHQAELIEQDAADAPQSAAAAFDCWTRRGVPQARHSHHFLGLSSKILAEEAPDLLATLEASGAYRNARWGEIEGERAYALMARRLPYEAIVRRAVEAEPGVTFHKGARVTGLVARQGPRTPHVVGVRIEDAGELRADLVVDASGRWTKAQAWLAEIGARPWREELQETPIFYLTRWYRLRDGATLPAGKYPIGVPLPYLLAIGFPADNRTFSVSLAPSMTDPLHARLRDPEVFARFLQAIPAMAAFADLGEPITDPQPLARINNCHRSLMDGAGPIVTGFVLLGDAADHTNPTLGRGVSLGLAHAQRLAETAEQAVAAPEDHAVAFDRWTSETLGAWFRGQVVADAGFMAGLEASLAGQRPAPPPAALAFRRASLALADEDAEVARAVAREMHLLVPPGTAQADPAIAAKVQSFIDRTKHDQPPRLGPTRLEFEALVG